MEDSKPSPQPDGEDVGEVVKKRKVKPVLKKHHVEGDGPAECERTRKKKEIKWDEEIIEEHDQLRGSRQKIDEPNTPYTHYDSHSDGNESDGSLRRPKSPAAEDQKVLSWDELHVKLTDVADAYPSSPSSYGDHIAEERKHQEFVEHRKHHYNEMEMVRKFKEEHGGLIDDDEDNDADDDMDMK